MPIFTEFYIKKDFKEQFSQLVNIIENILADFDVKKFLEQFQYQIINPMVYFQINKKEDIAKMIPLKGEI